MAVSVVKTGKRALSAILCILYCAITVVAHFPALHNHDHSARRSCCEGAAGCCDIDGHFTTSSIEISASECKHHTCVACLWHDMAKKSYGPASFGYQFAHAQCPMVLLRVAVFPAVSPFCLPLTRAPPTTIGDPFICG